MVDELNSTKDQSQEEKDKTTEPATLTPQQLNQVRNLGKLRLGEGPLSPGIGAGKVGK